jgi:hypothetical protein
LQTIDVIFQRAASVNFELIVENGKERGENVV